jgi:hypothetical protein
VKTVSHGIQYRADQAKRVAVTAQWLWDHPDTGAYLFDVEADNFGLDPWVTIVGVDAMRDGSKIILETGRIGERLVDPDELVFVQCQRTLADI